MLSCIACKTTTNKIKPKTFNNGFFRCSGVPKSKLKASGYLLLTQCAQATEIEKFFR
jgi:hypothetical protein